MQSLGLLFPPGARSTSQACCNDFQGSRRERVYEDVTTPIKTAYEDLHPIRILPHTGSAKQIENNWSLDLANLTIDRLQVLKSARPALQLYHLWRTFQLSCGEIEALLPQPQSNLPAVILEMIEKFKLPHDSKRYVTLQKAALVQFKTSQKLDAVEEHLRHSYIQDLSVEGVNTQVKALMGLIRAKIKAGIWIDAAGKKNQNQVSEKIHQDLVPLVMWHVERASIDNIRRLLLQPESSIKALISDGQRRLGAGKTDLNTVLKHLTAKDRSTQSNSSEPVSRHSEKKREIKRKAKNAALKVRESYTRVSSIQTIGMSTVADIPDVTLARSHLGREMEEPKSAEAKGLKVVAPNPIQSFDPLSSDNPTNERRRRGTSNKREQQSRKRKRRRRQNGLPHQHSHQLLEGKIACSDVQGET